MGRYTLHVPYLDDQHAILFGWYVHLKTAPQLYAVLSGLRAYAAGHFQDEERWANDHGIPTERHHDKHVDLLQRMDACLQENSLKRTSVQSLVYDWLTMHIDVDDRALVRLLRTS